MTISLIRPVRSLSPICPICRQPFTTTPQNRDRKKYCGEPACMAVVKQQYQQAWLEKPNNVSYFRGGTHVQRTADWRKAHPEARRHHRRGPAWLQEDMPSQITVLHENFSASKRAGLQDTLASEFGELLQMQHIFTAGDSHDSLAASADSALAVRTTGVLFVEQCLPGVPIPNRTMSCAEARLRVLLN